MRVLTGSGLVAALVLLFAAASPAAASTLVATATDAAIGQSVHANVQLSESPEAAGEISFAVFGPGDSDCSGPALDPAPTPASVSGEGEYSSGDITPPEAGNYFWNAHYTGDGANPEADSTCSAVSVIAKASPGLTGNATSATVGNAIHDEVTLSGGFSPGGEVTFRVYAPGDTGCLTPLATGSAPISGGHATSADFVPQQAGEFRWTAEYPGDGNNEAASLGCGAANQASIVGKASPTLSGVASSVVTVGSPISDTATLSGGFAAGGQLLFRAYGPGDGSCASAPAYEEGVTVNGDGPYSPAGFSPGPGLYRWTLEYAGDGNNEAASLGCGADNQASTVAKASPGLTGNATSATVGNAIHDEVTLSGGFSPGGEVTFRVYAPGDTGCLTPLATGSAPISGGHATSADFVPQQAGEFRWTAEYPGDGNNEAASLGCGAANQASIVGKASPTLSGVASSVVTVGSPISDTATLSGGFAAGGQLLFRAYGPGDGSCASAPAYEEGVTVNGDGPYSPAGFSPGPGLYRWTLEYAGDGNNEAASLGCGAVNQASAVGTVAVILAAGATSATVGNPVTATASLREGAIPAGQITFRAYPPGDANCTGAPAFTSTVDVAGNGSYDSAAFVPPRVGSYRWTVAYTGDPNHAPAADDCGQATSGISPAGPTIAAEVGQQFTVGTPFRVAATLRGGYAPGGKVTFRIYGPPTADCAKPMAVDTVNVTGNGTILSDPFVAQRPGSYRFVAAYSGDSENLAATEACGAASQLAVAQKRTPKVKPRARLSGRLISIRAHLSGAMSPSGAVTFRLYRPGDKRCQGKPAFSGGIAVRSNGSYLLAKYLATRSGTYRLSVGYSGDQRNRRDKGNCGAAQLLHVG
jgi:hypothetical protein